jgi:hypothetical protein
MNDDNAGFQNDDDNGGIQLVSVKKNTFEKETPLAPASNLSSPEDDDPEDEILTSGDLMAFAWQVAQGMVSLTFLIKRIKTGRLCCQRFLDHPILQCSIFLTLFRKLRGRLVFLLENQTV